MKMNYLSSISNNFIILQATNYIHRYCHKVFIMSSFMKLLRKKIIPEVKVGMKEENLNIHYLKHVKSILKRTKCELGPNSFDIQNLIHGYLYKLNMILSMNEIFSVITDEIISYITERLTSNEDSDPVPSNLLNCSAQVNNTCLIQSENFCITHCLNEDLHGILLNSSDFPFHWNDKDEYPEDSPVSISLETNNNKSNPLVLSSTVFKDLSATNHCDTSALIQSKCRRDLSVLPKDEADFIAIYVSVTAIFHCGPLNVTGNWENPIYFTDKLLSLTQINIIPHQINRLENENNLLILSDFTTEFAHRTREIFALNLHKLFGHLNSIQSSKFPQKPSSTQMDPFREPFEEPYLLFCKQSVCERIEKAMRSLDGSVL